MTKSTICSAYAKITADNAFKERTISMLTAPSTKAHPKLARRFQPVVAVAACALVAAVGLLAATSANGPTVQGPASKISAHSVKLPKPKIAAGNHATTAKMMNFVVYDNRYYMESGSEIDYADAEKLIDTKLGSTHFAITENTAAQHAAHSTYNGKGIDADATFEGDIYTVKGYDDKFRLIGVNEQGKYASVFDCTNGLTVSNGSEILGKLKLADNIESMTYARRTDDFAPAPVRSFSDFSLMNRFFTALDGSTPYLFDSIPSLDFSVQSDFIDLSLKTRDGFTDRLTLQKNGYVLYGICQAAFKPDSDTFNTLWSTLTKAN